MALRRRVYAGEVAGSQYFPCRQHFPKGRPSRYLPPRCESPKRRRRSEAAEMARNYMGSASTASSCSPARSRARQAGREHGRRHRQGRGRCRACARQTGVRPSAEYGRRRGRDRRRRRRDGAHGRQCSRAITPEQLARFKQQGIALTPTLSLFAKLPLAARHRGAPRRQRPSTSSRLFGQRRPVLFGTDVGFIQIYDTTLEYELMHRALSERQVLASLTTNPAQLFQGGEEGQGREGI